MQLFNLLGSLMGYLLWWLYLLFKNYGVAIILFSILIKVVTFPMQLKSQKSMASQGKLSAKQAELQKMYGNNKQKYNEELQKLYEKEGASPMGGCLPMLLPMLVMFGMFYTVSSPLSNTMHIDADTVSRVVSYVEHIPGIAATSAGRSYPEISVLQNYTILRNQIAPILSSANPVYVERMDLLSGGFNFLGLNLLATPAQSTFSSMMWLIPVLSLLTQYATSFYTQYSNKKMGLAQQQQQGCMKFMMYGYPLFFVYITFTTPGAMGFYWVMNGLTSTLQTVITNKFFSVNHMTAKTEAQRAVTLAAGEAAIKPLTAAAQKQIADRIEASAQATMKKELSYKSGGQNQKKQGKKSGGKQQSNQYRGNKK